MATEIIDKIRSYDFLWLPDPPRSKEIRENVKINGKTDRSHMVENLMNGSYSGDIVYSSMPVDGIAQEPIRKLSFKYNSRGNRKSRLPSSEYGWFDSENESIDDLDAELKTMPLSQIHSIDVIARWHEVNEKLDQNFPPNIMRRVLIRDFLISTRHFLPRQEPAPSPSITSKGSASALATMQTGRNYSEDETVSFAWAIPEFRVMRGQYQDYAEYLVVACFGESVLTSWRRYSDFSVWAQQAKALKCVEAVRAWEELTDSKKIYRCLDPKYLRLKSYGMECFLEQLLFEVPSYTILLSFFDEKKIQKKNKNEENVVIQQTEKLIADSQLLSTADQY